MFGLYHRFPHKLLNIGGKINGNGLLPNLILLQEILQKHFLYYMMQEFLIMILDLVMYTFLFKKIVIKLAVLQMHYNLVLDKVLLE